MVQTIKEVLNELEDSLEFLLPGVPQKIKGIRECENFDRRKELISQLKAHLKICSRSFDSIRSKLKINPKST